MKSTSCEGPFTWFDSSVLQIIATTGVEAYIYVHVYIFSQTLNLPAD